MTDLVSFDPGTARTDPNRTVEQLTLLLNRQGFLERSIVTPLRDRVEYGRGMEFFTRSSTTTFETHMALGSKTADALTTMTGTINTLKAVPFVTEDSFTKDRLEFEVTTGGAAGSVAHVGIYASGGAINGTPYPDALVATGTAIVTTSTGVKATTVAWVPVPGRLYFAATLFGVNAPTVRSIPQTNLQPFFGHPATLGASPQYGYTVASTYATTGLPSTFPAGATAITSGAIPAVFVRSAGVDTFVRYVEAFSPSREGYVLRRVKCWSAAGVPTAVSSAYFLIEPSVRVGSKTSTLGTFDTRKAKMTPGEVYYLTGVSEIDQALATDSILETKVSAVNRSDQSLEDVVVQWDYAFVGGQNA